MKKKPLLVLLAVLIAIPAFSKQHTYMYGKYRIGQSVYLWGDNVNVRSTPSVRGRVIGKIRIGTILYIKQVMKQTLTIRGYREPWYRVMYIEDEKDRFGYVWGGMLSKAEVSFSDRTTSNYQQYLLVGAFGRGPFKKITEARLVTALRTIGMVRFEPIFMHVNKGLDFGVSMSGRLLPGKGFPKGIKIFAVDFEYGACDFPNGSVFLVWNGKRLYEGFRLLYASNENGGLRYRVYLPGQQGTPDGTIKVVYTSYRNVFNNGQNRQIGKKGTVTYRWNGRGFTKSGKVP